MSAEACEDHENNADFDLFGETGAKDYDNASDLFHNSIWTPNEQNAHAENQHPTHSQWKDVESANRYNTSAMIDRAHSQTINSLRLELSKEKGKEEQNTSALMKRHSTWVYEIQFWVTCPICSSLTLFFIITSAPCRL